MPHGSLTSNLLELTLLNERLDLEHDIFQQNVSAVFAFLSSLPQPAWIKSKDLRMLYINKEYEQRYGVTLEEYNALTDEAVWDKMIAEEYQTNDRTAMLYRETLRVKEAHVDKSGVLVYINVVKWPLIVNGEVVGVAGLTLD